MSRRVLFWSLSIGLCVLMSLFTLWAIYLRPVPLRIAKETTWLTEPLTADGKYVDYLKAWEERNYPPEMRTDENGYRLIVRSLGDLTYMNEMQRAQTYEKLGLDPRTPPTLPLETPGSFHDNYVTAHPELDIKNVYNTWNAPWTFETLPMMREWLEKNNPALDLIAEAAHKPVFCVPATSDREDGSTFFLLYGFRKTKDFADALQARANYRAGTADIDGTIEDTIALCRLGRFTAGSGVLFHQILGDLIANAALFIPLTGVSGESPTVEQLRRLAAEMDALPEYPPTEKVLENERLFLLSYFQEGAKFRLDLRNGEPSLFAATDWNVATREVNRGFDLLAAGGTYVAPAPNANPLMRWAVRQRSLTLAAAVFQQEASVFARSKEMRQQTDCMMRLRRLALALLIYEKEHGRLPNDNWRQAIRPLLGDDPDRYFRCPACSSTENVSTYALVRRGPLLLVELATPLPVDAPDPPLDRSLCGSGHGSFTVAYRNGTVKHLEARLTPQDEEALRTSFDEPPADDGGGHAD